MFGILNLLIELGEWIVIFGWVGVGKLMLLWLFGGFVMLV